MIKTKTTVEQIGDFKSVCSCLKSFEVSNSLGSMLAGLVIGHVKEQAKEGASDDSIPKMKTAYVGNIEGLTRECVGSLQEIGLGLQTSKADFTIFAPTETLEAQDLSLVLRDGGRFVDFLSKASKSEVADSELKAGVSMAIRNCTSRLIADDLQDPSDATLELFKVKTALLGNLSDMGLNEDRDKLEARFDQADKGILRETVLAEKAHLTGSVSDEIFAAHSWQKDASVELFDRKWDEALSTLETICKNPKAKELRDRCKSYLVESVAAAREDIPNLDYIDNENGVEFLKTLDRAEERLEKL